LGAETTGLTAPPALRALRALPVCNLCHAQEKIADTAVVHAENLPENQGTVTATIDSVTFGAPVDNVVPVTVKRLGGGHHGYNRPQDGFRGQSLLCAVLHGPPSGGHC